jgi:hypothetical protein
MIPIAFDKVMTFGGNDALSFCIIWDYADGSGRTIALCEGNPEVIDFESFGTTYALELRKVGLTPKDVQIIGKDYRRRAYNIKDQDGVARPYYDYEIDYDFVDGFIDDEDDIGTRHPKHRIGPFKSEIDAREYFKRYIERYLWQEIKNLTFTPVEPGQNALTD